MNEIPENCLTCEKYKYCNNASYLSLACDHYETFIENKNKEKKEENINA